MKPTTCAELTTMMTALTTALNGGDSVKALTIAQLVNTFKVGDITSSADAIKALSADVDHAKTKAHKVETAQNNVITA